MKIAQHGQDAPQLTRSTTPNSPRFPLRDIPTALPFVPPNLSPWKEGTSPKGAPPESPSPITNPNGHQPSSSIPNSDLSEHRDPAKELNPPIQLLKTSDAHSTGKPGQASGGMGKGDSAQPRPKMPEAKSGYEAETEDYEGGVRNPGGFVKVIC